MCNCEEILKAAEEALTKLHPGILDLQFRNRVHTLVRKIQAAREDNLTPAARRQALIEDIQAPLKENDGNLEIIEVGDIVMVQFNAIQNTLCRRAEVLFVSSVPGYSWIFKNLENGKIHYISEPVSVTLLEKKPWL